MPARVSSAEENAHLGPPPFLSEAAESFPDALPDRKIYPSMLFRIPQISPTYWAYRWVLVHHADVTETIPTCTSGEADLAAAQ